MATSILFRTAVSIVTLVIGKLLPMVEFLQVLISGFGSLIALLAGAAGTLLGLHMLVLQGLLGEEAALSIPLVGWVYERLLAPATYYRIDTALMFQKD